MNSCIFIGNMAVDPETRSTQNGKMQCNFRLAVQRRYKDENGERQADFFNCVAWGQTADIIHKFFHKGDKIGLRGSMQNRSYQAQDGTTRYVTELIVDQVDGMGQARQNAPAGKDSSEGLGFVAVDVDDAQLPF